MSASIDSYALIGDGITAGLISREGSLDWLCWPRFDGAACFAALLGTSEHGCWSITPADPVVHHSRRYLTDSVVLESSFQTTGGVVQLLDFMPLNAPVSSVVRLVIGVDGEVAMRSVFAPRFDYGVLMPWVELNGRELLARAGPHKLVLRAPVDLKASPQDSSADFRVRAGERLAFVLCYTPAHEPVPAALDAEEQLEHTCRDWQQWIDRLKHRTLWPRAVRRSLLTLRALVHRPTGGLIAAPTTSLPERFGGSKNWDYRYSWLRDSTFTLTALLNAGFREEGAAWRDWILRAIAAEPPKMHTVYRVDGAREIFERELPWLPGYAHSRPVRIGNRAAYQVQNDIYGEVIDTLELATRAGVPQTPHGQHIERGIVEYLERIWDRPGQGLWESRGDPHHYTYSRVMAWVGIDRFLRSAGRFGHADQAWCERLQDLKQRIRADVYERGFDARRGCFVQHYGSEDLDASLLLLPLVGFIDVNDVRMSGTIRAIERELVQDGLVMRQTHHGDGPRVAFLACSCWLADCWRLQGREAEARAAIERLIGVSNDLGLLAEEYSLSAQRQCGNFPQALTHMALVNSALAMAGPILERGGK